MKYFLQNTSIMGGVMTAISLNLTHTENWKIYVPIALIALGMLSVIKK